MCSQHEANAPEVRLEFLYTSFPERHQAEWYRWEFLRRNPNYRLDYERLIGAHGAWLARKKLREYNEDDVRCLPFILRAIRNLSVIENLGTSRAENLCFSGVSVKAESQQVTTIPRTLEGKEFEFPGKG